MIEFMKKNKKLLIIGGTAVVLGIFVILGFVVNAAASSYLKKFSDEAEKLFKNADDLNIVNKGGFALVKAEVEITPAAPVAEEGKNPSEVAAAPTTPEKKEVVIVMELERVVTDEDFKKLDAAAQDPKEVASMSDVISIYDDESSIPDEFTYLDTSKFGKIVQDDPGFFANIGLFFGLGGSSGLYENIKSFAGSLKSVATNLKKDTFAICMFKDKKGSFYACEKAETGNDFKVKVESREVKSFKEAKDEKNTADIARVVLMPASKVQKPSASTGSLGSPTGGSGHEGSLGRE